MKMSISLSAAKFTDKQLNGFISADRELMGISANDEYNKSTYGITQAQYAQIKKAVVDMFGSGGRHTLAEVKKAVKNL